MRTILTITLMAAFLSPAAIPSQQEGQRSLYPSMVQLLANPAAFDGKRVTVFGFLWASYDEDILCLHKEDYVNYLLANCVWLDSSRAVGQYKAELNLKYTRIAGTFEVGGKGNMLRDAPGGIAKITSIELWSDPAHPQSERS